MFNTFARMGFRLALVLLLVWSNSPSLAQKKFVVIKDFSSTWMHFDGHEFLPVGSANLVDTNTIYFTVNLNEFGHDILRIEAEGSFHVFLNGRILTNSDNTLDLYTDSLRKSAGASPVSIGVYQPDLKISSLNTLVLRQQAQTEEVLGERPASTLRDFVVAAGLILMVFFVAMLQAHPKLVSEYLSIVRIFTFRDAEDNQGHAKFTLASNVAFYIFFSLLMSLLLVILFSQLPANFSVSMEQTNFGLLGYFLQWVKFGAIVLLFLLAKLALIYALSFLFGMRIIAGVHFFNLMRLLTVFAGVVTIVAFVYTISRGIDAQVYVALLSSIVGALILWNVIVFLKLNTKVEHSMFHLFSYICATEVIPLLITIKVLFQ